MFVVSSERKDLDMNRTTEMLKEFIFSILIFSIVCSDSK